jgi:hypothetical protein
MTVKARPGAYIVGAMVALLIALVMAAQPSMAASPSLPGSANIAITTLSTRADRVSGNSALVEIDSRSGRRPTTITLNGSDVSSAFQPSAQTGSFVGLVTGLRIGPNLLTARGPGLVAQTLRITDYPITGPITSGRQASPFLCTTSTFLIPDDPKGPLGSDFGGTPIPYSPALDANCSGPTRITYIYMPTGGTKFLILPSTTALPANVATTTTSTGKTVRFIVRVETSTIDRGIYESAVLSDPTTEPNPTPTAPPTSWNNGLVAIAGFGCPGGWYTQGGAIGNLSFGGMDFSMLSPARLGEGYALFSNTLMHPSNNCNSVLSGEAASMSKEHFIDTYGVPRYTVAEGCSGGSYGSIQLADAVPGLYDGVLIACTFPDPLAIAVSGSDGRLLDHYFVTHPGTLTTAQEVAITGYKSIKAFDDAAAQSGRTDPIIGRTDDPALAYVAGPCPPGLPAAQIYNPTTNPRGARCDLFDAAKNVYGTNPVTGAARRPYDNVGVQYGSNALKAGIITPQQFIDLNAGIGGFDQDANYVPTRSVGDVGAIRRAFESGLEFSGTGGAGKIPVFDITGIYNDDSGYHYQWEHFATRARLAQANGNADNEVMWRGNPVPFSTAWSTFIGWVQKVTDDASHRSQRAKVIADKPVTATDGCWSSATTFIKEPQTFATSGSACNTLFPSFAFPRFVAGGPVAENILKCQTMPVRRSDYPSFTNTQFAQLAAISPSGVCDWSRPGIGSAPVLPGLSFGPAPQNFFAIGTSR